jgi:hypothetical protein
MGQGNCYVYYKFRCILSIDGALSISTVLSVMIGLSQYQIMIAIPAPDLVCNYTEAEYFCQVAYRLWQSVGELYGDTDYYHYHHRYLLYAGYLYIYIYLFIYLFLRQTMSLRNAMLQLFCRYCLWCPYH